MLSYQTFVTFPSLSYLFTLCCFINFCRLIKLSPSYQTFVIFSPFVIYSTFYVTYVPYKCTCCTHHTHNFYSRLIERTSFAIIQFPNSTAVLGHRAILIWGVEAWLGVFSKNNLLPLGFILHKQLAWRLMATLNPLGRPITTLEATGGLPNTCLKRHCKFVAMVVPGGDSVDPTIIRTSRIYRI